MTEVDKKTDIPPLPYDDAIGYVLIHVEDGEARVCSNLTTESFTKLLEAALKQYRTQAEGTS